MLILASASPRRQELLRNARISFAVEPANIDETPVADETPPDCAERLAREKALTVWRSRPQDVVLGADTIVVVDDTMLGKPLDEEDAARMLRLLSGREHRVITGVCLVSSMIADGIAGAAQFHEKSPLPAKPAGNGAPSSARPLESFRSASETTLVTFDQLSEKDIRDYVATGEPMDKAGAYAIQGIASRWIPRIEGDYSNVVGLPIALVYRMLRERMRA
jgi:nucleoside triphosphate pyrophosphatase